MARDEISGRVARYDYDEVDNLISAEYERGGEVERLYRVSDRMGNLFETRERDDRRYDAGGRLAEDREHFYHYDCEGNLVFKEFKEMVLHGGIVAPINKERLETELASVSAPSARAGVTTGKQRHARPRCPPRRQGSVVRLRRPRPPHPKIFCRNDHAVRLGRQRSAARVAGSCS